MYHWLDKYLRAKPGAEHDYKLEWQWDRYMIRGKLFAAICSPGPEHKTYGGRPLINLKCDPGVLNFIGRSFPIFCPAFTAISETGSPFSWTVTYPKQFCGSCATIPMSWFCPSCPSMFRKNSFLPNKGELTYA